MNVQVMIREVLQGRADRQLLRGRGVWEPVGGARVRGGDGRELINFASNDYLGLTQHPRVREAMIECINKQGAGSGSAGLISGHSPVHASAEEALAKWKGFESAILLPSGYQANLAAVQTYAALGQSAAVGAGGVRFLMDKLAHASLIDAVRGSGAGWRVFPHNHLGKLERLLREADAGQIQVVVTESIFSMDGDGADLAGLQGLKEVYGFQLLLDEAHGSGVYGEAGAGYANEMGMGDLADVSVVTCSKAMGVCGGMVCASRGFADLLLQFGRAYIYSTNLPGFVAAGVDAALGVMREEPWRQARVRELARRVRGELGTAGMEVGGLEDSPILPIMMGEESAALAAAGRMREAGMLVVAVRPPTVPRGGSRLRVTLSSEHGDEEVGRLVDLLKRMGNG